ncbi:MAG: hypothetical protein Q8M92_00990, partial [Candidatus Subteraquimicrobiales bacterium]|nr:hypothetical protein [Candidatus Subteraquimicrobiales bacterium]
HEIVGKLVSHALEKGLYLNDLKIEDYKKLSELFDEDIFEHLKLKVLVESKTSRGGTSSQSVKEQLNLASEVITEEEKWLASKQ